MSHILDVSDSAVISILGGKDDAMGNNPECQIDGVRSARAGPGWGSRAIGLAASSRLLEGAPRGL